MLSLCFLCSYSYAMEDIETGYSDDSDFRVVGVMDRSESLTLADRSLHVTMGRNPDHLKKRLARRLEGATKPKRIIPLHMLRKRKDKTAIKRQLAEEATAARERALQYLTQDGMSDLQLMENLEANHAISQMVCHEMALENHEEKELRVKPDRWKNINGGIAVGPPIGLPVITGLIQYYITKDNCNCDGDGSSA